MLTEHRTELPLFTRFVQAACLCGIEGLSLGFAVATSLYSSRLVQFVKSNRIDAKLRKEMLALVLLPAFILPLLILTLSLVSTQLPKGRIHQMERRIHLLAPLCGLGFFPLLLRPTLWTDQSLAFLLVTGVFATVVTLTVRTSARAWADGRVTARHWTDFDSLRAATIARISPKLLSMVTVAALLVVASLSVVHSMRDTVLAGSVINAEWTTLHKISSSSSFSTWLGPKGWRISGHLGYLGAVYAAAATLLSKPEGLLLLRVSGVVSAAIPLYMWSKRSLGVMTAGLIAFAYLSMPIVGMLQLRDTFPITIALGVFFLAAHKLESGRIRSGLVLVLLGIALNEQIALWFALLGAYLARWEHRKSLGQWLAVTALAYFLVVAL